MEISEMLSAVLSGMSIAVVVLLGTWRMLAHYEKRNDRAPGELRDAITASETRLELRIDRLQDEMKGDYRRLDERLRSVEQGFAQIDQRLSPLSES